MTLGQYERDRATKMKSGGGRDRNRMKQTPNSLFSLSNLNHRKGQDGGMGEWRKGGGR